MQNMYFVLKLIYAYAGFLSLKFSCDGPSDLINALLLGNRGSTPTITKVFSLLLFFYLKLSIRLYYIIDYGTPYP